MSEFIRKITGIGGSSNVNYIPVVHYCICESAAEDEIKEAVWVGNSDGTTADEAGLDLYPGLTLAVYFLHGIGSADSDTQFKLKLQNTAAKLIKTDGDSILNHVYENSVVVFTYDETCYRVVNGITGAQADDLLSDILARIDSATEGVVQLPFGDEGYAYMVGDEDQPIYVAGKEARAISGTFGSETNPIWLNAGHFTASTVTVGSDTLPLKMVDGALTPVSAALATQAALNDEIDRAQNAEEALSDRIDNLTDNYHNGGTYTFESTSGASGLNASITGNNIADITLHLPIYYGTGTPTITANIPVGAIYIELPIVNVENEFEFEPIPLEGGDIIDPVNPTVPVVS